LLAIGCQGLEFGTADGEVDFKKPSANIERRKTARLDTQITELSEAAAHLLNHVALAVIAPKRLPRVTSQETVP
jgi:hypothetical protein